MSDFFKFNEFQLGALKSLWAMEGMPHDDGTMLMMELCVQKAIEGPLTDMDFALDDFFTSMPSRHRPLAEIPLWKLFDMMSMSLTQALADDRAALEAGYAGPGQVVRDYVAGVHGEAKRNIFRSIRPAYNFGQSLRRILHDHTTVDLGENAREIFGQDAADALSKATSKAELIDIVNKLFQDGRT